MNSPIAERLQDAVSQARWNEAVALLQTCDAVQAAAALGNLPFEQQQSLFRRLPQDLAAAVVAQFPYYHEYVLLHSLSLEKMRALVDKLNPNDRMRFFDDLPEEAWQRLMDELSSVGAAETSGQHEPETVVAPEEQPPHPGEPIIEAFQIEKGFEQPDGRQIQIIAPMDLSVESDTIFALRDVGDKLDCESTSANRVPKSLDFLRKKLDAAGPGKHYLRTEPWVIYRFEPDSSSAA